MVVGGGGGEINDNIILPSVSCSSVSAISASINDIMDAAQLYHKSVFNTVYLISLPLSQCLDLLIEETIMQVLIVS